MVSCNSEGTRRLPVARLECARGGATWGQKCGREVTVFNANEIFPALPQARPPLFQPVEFLVGVIRNLSALAVVRGDCFDGSGIRHRQIAEAAEPTKPCPNAIAIEMYGRFSANNVGMFKV